MQLGCPDLQRHLCQKPEVNLRIFASQAFKDFKIQSFLRYLIDKLGEQNEREKKAFKRFLETNAASLKNNSMCTPVSNNMSNVSNNCHIVYMDGSPSYPATGASVINLSQGAQARWKFVYQIYPPAIDTLVTGMVLTAILSLRSQKYFCYRSSIWCLVARTLSGISANSANISSWSPSCSCGTGGQTTPIFWSTKRD